MNILIIEDDVTLRTELAKLLSSYGYNCTCANDFESVIPDAVNSNADLILLDINLPYRDGYHICREIRSKSDVPIIIVTSRNTDMDELMGINLGADDFVAKPYNKQILLARIESVLKRANKHSISDEVEYKGLIVCPSKSTAQYDGKTQELTKNELHILSVLIKNAGKIVSRDELMEELWQSDEFVDDNTLTVNINRLRSKLSQIGLEGIITTKRGQGYMI